MILTLVYPAPFAPIDVEDKDERAQLVDLYRPPRPDWVRLNLVGSVSGSATGSDGTSETLSNPADRLLLRVIRSLADVVLVGAATVRAEGYFVPRHAALAVVTASGDLAGHRITSTGGRGALVVLCPGSAVARVRESIGNVSAVVIVVPDVGGRLSAAGMIEALRERGYRSIVSEGGPSLAAQLLDAGVVDELCLSTSPVLGGTNVPLFGTEVIRGTALKLNGLLVDSASGVYARWGVANPTTGD